jgi:hypothetical protein
MKLACSEMIQFFRQRGSVLEGVDVIIGEPISSFFTPLNPVTRNK